MYVSVHIAWSTVCITNSFGPFHCHHRPSVVTWSCLRAVCRGADFSKFNAIGKLSRFEKINLPKFERVGLDWGRVRSVSGVKIVCCGVNCVTEWYDSGDEVCTYETKKSSKYQNIFKWTNEQRKCLKVFSKFVISIQNAIF